MIEKLNAAGYPEPGVYSQSGILREVLLHRPNIALSRLTPENLHELLFDDMPLPEVALEHYDLFVQMLRDNGVQVTFLHDCMVEALKQPGAKKFVLDKRHDLDRFSVMKKDIKQWLMEISEEDLALYLTGGLLFDDLPKNIKRSGFIAANQPKIPPQFVLRPLPNQMFCRDTSGWAHNGVVLCNMFYDAKKKKVPTASLR